MCDDRGLVVERTDALGGKSLFAYTAISQLEQVTDRNLDITTFSYTDSGKAKLGTDHN